MAGFIQSQKSDIDIRGTYNTIFDACVQAGSSMGKIIQQNKNMGFISFKTKMTWIPPRNPVSLRVSIKEKEGGMCNISFDTQSFDGLVGVGSCGRVIDSFVNSLSERL